MAFITVPELMLRVRFPTEVHDVREFIQPNQFHLRHALLEVKDKYGEVTPFNCWDWVCSEVRYPRDSMGRPNEYHRMDSYAIRQYYVVGAGWVTDPQKRQQVWWEWFDFPWEILAGSPKIADCDGKAILLCNMLRTIGEPARVGMGGFATDKEALSHAWVVSGGQVLETTTDNAGLSYPENNGHYIPLIYFDESTVTLDPSVYDALKDLDYVPALGDVYRGLGIGYDCKKKSQVMCQMIQGSLACEFVEV